MTNQSIHYCDVDCCEESTTDPEQIKFGSCPKNSGHFVPASKKRENERKCLEANHIEAIKQLEGHLFACIRCDVYTETMTECGCGELKSVDALKSELETELRMRIKKLEIKYPNHKPEESEESDPSDILLNQIIQKDRFGQGLKKGKLYYGVIVSDKKDKMHPAVFYSDKLIYGTENLESAGFKFGKDFVLLGETLDKTRLHEHIHSSESIPSTKELVDRIVKLNSKYAYHEDDRTHIVIAAYIMFSYMFSAFKRVARLVFVGLPGSGKSTQTDLIALLSMNPILGADISKASLYRSVEVSAGVVIVDNFDNISDESKFEFVQLYDTSFEEGRPVLRCEEITNKPTAFRTFCPLVLNCVDSSWIKSSSLSRSILIRMVINDQAALEDIETIDKKEIEDIKHQLRIWAIENVDKIRKITKELSAFRNRKADITRPLLAILREAGEKQYEQGFEFLDKNFSEHHTEDDYSPSSMILVPLWNFLLSQYKDTKEIEIGVFIKEIATLTLTAKGITPKDEEGKQNYGFDRAFFKECQSVASIVRNFPYARKTKPGNRVRYHFNIKSMAKFMKSRGYDIGPEGESLLQSKLTDLPNLTKVNQNSEEVSSG